MPLRELPLGARRPPVALGAVLEHGVTLMAVLLLGLPALEAWPFLQGLTRQLEAGSPRTLWLSVGALVGAVALAVGRRNRTVAFLDTLQHELSHLVVGLLMLIPPRALRASDATGGGVDWDRVSGPLARPRIFLAAVAPYWFSPIVVAPAMLALAFPPRPGLWLGLLGVLLGLALAFPILQIHPRQTDLRRYGLIPPILAALWLWIALAVVTYPVVARGSLAPVSAAYSAAWRSLVGLLT